MVIGATVNFLLTGPSQAPWSVGHCKLDSIILQFGVEGGSKILHGISPSDTLTFIFQDQQIADRLIFDGHILQPRDFVVLPPGSDFTFASCGIHRWVSISMPVGFFEAFAVKTGRTHLAWVEKEKCVISPPGTIARMFDRGSREHGRAHTREANVDVPWSWYCPSIERIDRCDCGFGQPNMSPNREVTLVQQRRDKGVEVCPWSEMGRASGCQPGPRG